MLVSVLTVIDGTQSVHNSPSPTISIHVYVPLLAFHTGISAPHTAIVMGLPLTQLVTELVSFT